MLSYLSPLQVGVGVKGGTQAAVHATKAYLRALPCNSGKHLLTIDFANAFNSISRGALLEAVAARAPQLAPWVFGSYARHSDLWIRNGDRITSECGVQQGDPLGPLLFALALQPILERVHAEVPGLDMLVFYLDDGTLAGTAAQLSQALEIIVSAAALIGLRVRIPKCALYTPSSEDEPPDDFLPAVPRKSPQDGLRLLGSLLGSEEAARTHSHAKVADVAQAMALLPELEDPQTALLLLRQCLLPRLEYVLETSTTSELGNAPESFDESTLLCVEQILGMGLTPPARSQAQLPIRMGGLGLRSAALVAPAAYIGSRVATHRLVGKILRAAPVDTSRDLKASITSSLAAFPLPPASPAPEAARPNAAALEKEENPRQKLLEWADSSTKERLAGAATPRDRARLLSAAGAQAGAFLHALPLAHDRLRLHPAEIRVAIGFRLGLTLLPEHQCPECGEPLDPGGDHAVSCSHGGDRISRHNLLGRILGSALASAGHPPRYEDPNIVPSRDRPADISTPGWTTGRPTAFDVTVVSPTAPSNVTNAAKEQGATAAAAETLKNRKYDEVCRQAGVQFWPMAIETFGTAGPQAEKLVSLLGGRLASRLGSPRSETISRLRQQLSVGVARGTATMILNRLQ
mmetsp:Transcript_2547/g.5878  ORF Transcript_2547/g.5878 Transcript_2547/m.5878 type:complete len:633 (+) Transcript_2547:396-2294(+)